MTELGANGAARGEAGSDGFAPEQWRQDPEPYNYIHTAILFAELENSVMLSSTLPPLDYDRLLNSFQDAMLRLLQDLQTLDIAVPEFYIAGGQLALFFYDPAEVERNRQFDGPNPIQGEERVALAARCRAANDTLLINAFRTALMLRTNWLVEEINIERTRQRREPLGLGIGLHSGQVYLHDRPDDRYRIEGFAVNLAKRVETFSTLGNYSRIMLSEAAHNRLVSIIRKHTQLRQRLFFKRHEVSMEQLKGVADSQAVFELKFSSRYSYATRQSVKNTAEIIKQYELIFALNPGNIWAYYQLFDYYAFDTQNWERLLELIKMALPAHPNDGKVILDLALYYLHNGDLGLARQLAEQSLTLNPEFDLAYERLAIIADAEGDQGGKLAALRKAVTLAPGSPLNHFNLAVALCEHGQSGAATQHFREALRGYPGFARDLDSRQMVGQQVQAGRAPDGIAALFGLDPVTGAAVPETSHATVAPPAAAKPKPSRPPAAADDAWRGGADPHAYIHAAILFADLENSVMLSSSLPPLDYDRLLNSFQHTMLELVRELRALGIAVQEYSVAGDQLAVYLYDPTEPERNRLLDGAGALTGQAREDLIAQCRRSNDTLLFNALKAALMLKNNWLVSEVNLSRASQHREPLGLAIGLHSGQVYLHQRPDGKRRVEGFSVNLGKRVEGYARLGKYSRIMFSEAAHNRIVSTISRHTQLRQRIFFQPHDVDFELLKGVVQRQTVYELKFFSKIGVKSTPAVIEQHEQLFVMDPANIWSYYQLFEHYAYIEQDWKRVLKLIKAALPMHPHDEKLMLDLSRYYFRHGDLGLAKQLAEQALQQNPQFDLACEHLSEIARRQGDHRAELELKRLAVALAPGSPVNHFNLAIVLCEAGETGAGAQHFQEALSGYPDYATMPAAQSVVQELANRGLVPVDIAEAFGLAEQVQADTVTVPSR